MLIFIIISSVPYNPIYTTIFLFLLLITYYKLYKLFINNDQCTYII